MCRFATSRLHESQGRIAKQASCEVLGIAMRHSKIAKRLSERRSRER